MQYEAAACVLSPPDDPDALKHGIDSPIDEMNKHFRGVGALAHEAGEVYHACERRTRVGDRRFEVTRCDTAPAGRRVMRISMEDW